MPYRNEAAHLPGSVAQVRIGNRPAIASVEGGAMSGAELKTATAAFSKSLTRLARRRPAIRPRPIRRRSTMPMVLLLLVILVLYVTMVYGPIAALLVELFPARIRYTSMSLPYHIGNGWFGGFLPTVAFAIVALTGDIYYGLWYPIIVALITVVIGMFFLPETKDRELQ